MGSNIREGIYPNMTDEEYFGSAELTNSDFRLLSESALHLANKDLFALSGGKFTFGSALHCSVLEPHLFDERYAVEKFEGSDLNKNSLAYKEARANWIKSADGKEILTADQHEQIKLMTKNVLAIAGDYLSDGDPESAMFADMDGVFMSGKADYINHKLRWIFDVKTTQSIKKFGQSCVDYNYVSQSAIYPDIAKEVTGKNYKFAFILVETTAPYNVAIRFAPASMIEIGRAYYQEMIKRYKDYRDHGIVDIAKAVRLPEWYLSANGYGKDL